MDEVNTYINGDIYIRVTPTDISDVVKDLIALTEYALGELDRVEATNEDLDADCIREPVNDVLEHLKDEKTSLYYGACEHFNILRTDGENHVMISVYPKENVRIKTEDSELKDDYIKLTDFLGSAKYIGRRFRRTVNFEGVKRFTPIPNDELYVVALYATDDAMLVLNVVSDGSYFGMLDPRYFKDGKYELYGGNLNIHTDRKELYKSILLQTYKKYQDNNKASMHGDSDDDSMGPRERGFN